ncbi:MAG: ArsA family ATPase [Actinomycetota bacterium]|jgi:anion-transporting  ArsA/GET3 family ATPase
MQIDEFLDPKVLIVSGKGGVGKTTVAAALALVAARHGRKVCMAEVDRKGTLPKLFGGGEVNYQPRELSPGVWGLNLNPEDALAEYLRVQYHMSRISRVFRSTHFVDYITTAAPGLKDILVLGKIWYLEQDRDHGGGAHGFDTIIVDAPAAGHMARFLQAPQGLADAVRVGPIRRQSEWLNEMLTDPRRSRVHLVALAEEMPVTETLETSTALDKDLGIPQGPLFANGIYTGLLTDEEAGDFETIASDDNIDELCAEAKVANINLDAEDLEALLGYARFLKARRDIQSRHLRKLRRGSSQPVIELPFLFSAGLALPDIETLADVVEEQVEKL